MFKDLPAEMTYYTDKFTPASFLTQAMNVPRENLENVDLIRRLPDKVFLVPDLAPLFGIKDDELKIKCLNEEDIRIPNLEQKIKFYLTLDKVLGES